MEGVGEGETEFGRDDSRYHARCVTCALFNVATCIAEST